MSESGSGLLADGSISASLSSPMLYGSFSLPLSSRPFRTYPIAYLLLLLRVIGTGEASTTSVLLLPYNVATGV